MAFGWGGVRREAGVARRCGGGANSDGGGAYSIRVKLTRQRSSNEKASSLTIPCVRVCGRYPTSLPRRLSACVVMTTGSSRPRQRPRPVLGHVQSPTQAYSVNQMANLATKEGGVRAMHFSAIETQPAVFLSYSFFEIYTWRITPTSQTTFSAKEKKKKKYGTLGAIGDVYLYGLR